MRLFLCLWFVISCVSANCVDYGEQLTCTNEMKLKRIYVDIKVLILINAFPRFGDMDVFLPHLELVEFRGLTTTYCDMVPLGYDVIGCQGWCYLFSPHMLLLHNYSELIITIPYVTLTSIFSDNYNHHICYFLWMLILNYCY